MAKTFDQVYKCVIKKIRDFCFAQIVISDDVIGGKIISELNITQDSRMPGVSPLAGLAAALKKCVDVDVPLTEDWLNQNQTETVKQIAQYIYNQAVIAEG